MIYFVNNFFKCVRCNKMLISEECQSHKCQVEMKGSKIIEIIFHTIAKDKEGNTLIITETIDGIFLTLKQFTKPKNMFKPYNISPNFKHPNGTPEESTEPIFLLFILKVIIITNFLFYNYQTKNLFVL
jgi:hypothetical protein